ncbi:MAG: SpoIIE family protein phosphatase [Bacteroidales bacterium]|nr:SpoIIE family protein phosphatase [Bacteroidales bacterium]
MNKLSYILFFFSVLFFISFNKLPAQQHIEQGNPFIQNYCDKDYRSHENQNWAVIQDKRGIMYFGNNRGLLEFDGTNWRLIEIPNKSIVRSLAIDSIGRIYIGAEGELGYIETDSTGTMQYISLINEIPEENRNFQDVWEIFIINDQVIYRTNYYIFILKGSKITVLKSDNSFHAGFCVNNQFYVREWETGLLTLINDSLKIVPQGEQFANKRIYVMLPYEKDKILIITRSQGIIIYSSDEKNDNMFLAPDSFQKANDFLKNNKIYCGVKLDNKHFVLGTLQNGLIIIDNNGNIIKHINKKSGLKDNTIHYLYIDKQKNIWLALNNGISFITINSPFTFFNEKAGLHGLVFTSIVYNNNLYAGTSLGIFRKDKQNNFSLLKNTKGQNWYLSEIKGKLYCGHNNGIFLVNETRAENIAKISNTWTFIELSNYPGFVLAGTKAGLILLEQKNKKLTHACKIRGFEESVRYMQEDYNGNIWISNMFKGVYKIILNESLDSVKELNFYNMNNGLPANTLNFVFKIKTVNKKSRIIFGTENGIYKYDQHTNQFISDNKFNDIIESEGTVDQIAQDENGNIYFQKGDDKGILLLQKDGTYKLKNTSLLKFKGMYFENICIIDTSTILFGTNDGIINFNPYTTSCYDILFPVLIRKVITNDSIILEVQTTDDIITLPYKQNTILFDYTALFYENCNRNQYSHFLKGFDNGWSEWSLKTEKEYTNLPEGSYSFNVKAKNIFEKESIITKYQFEILPPWYRTVWAFIFYGITIFLVVWLIVKLNIKRLKIEKENLEKIVKERTFEINRQKENIEEKNIELEQQKEEILTQADQLVLTNQKLEKLSIVASETDNAVVIMDTKGNFEWVNEGFTRLYGFTFNQLIDEVGWNILEISSNPNIEKKIFDCIHNRETAIYETIMKTRTGKTIYAQTTVTPIIDNDGKVKNLVAIDSNISKIKKAEQEIIRQSDEITDSITYAKRIQNAILPADELIQSMFEEYFILYKPRGIVSGDFYWVTKVNGIQVVVVADCTGHGVPGAFMSMLGVTLLNKIVIEKEIIEPSEILNRLKKNIIVSLHQTGKEGEADDGMDVSVIAIDKGKRIISFAGAINSLFIVRSELVPPLNNLNKSIFQNHNLSITQNYGFVLNEIKGDRMPVSFHQNLDKSFANHQFELLDNDAIYLSTDGFRDQFGGPKEKRYKTSKLKDLLLSCKHKKMAEQQKILDNDFQNWKGSLDQVDDICIFGVKYKIL